MIAIGTLLIIIVILVAYVEKPNLALPCLALAGIGVVLVVLDLEISNLSGGILVVPER